MTSPSEQRERHERIVMCAALFVQPDGCYAEVVTAYENPTKSKEIG